MIATNAARTDDPYNEDFVASVMGVGVPYTMIKIDGVDLNLLPAFDGSGIPPKPNEVTYGGTTKYYQHLPMTSGDANSMQVILEAFVK